MSYFRKHDPLNSVLDILKLNTPAGKALVQYHMAVMRQQSDLSIQEREWIAAYVSGLNHCHYCHGVHSVTAREFGVEPELLEALLQEVETAPIEAKMKPLFRLVKQLTEDPARMTNALVDKVLEAGWSEQAVHDAINVCCLFNFMNRLLEGHGIKGRADLYEERGKALQKNGYDPLLTALSQVDAV
ncbi:MAG: peroxidase-related enzyme [Verrucomicrobiae bacterium]|nr:peroxidase-related enzyme [Verrucomicrobiae bacterium]